MLEAFIDRLQKVQTLDELNDQVVALRDVFDVEHVVYHSVNSTGEQYAALTYSPEWVGRYLEQDYARIDPVVQACYRRFHPIDWKRLDWSGKNVREFRGEAGDSGVGVQGFSVPIRGPSGQFALFSLSDNRSDDKWKGFTENHIRDLLLVSHYINQKALELEKGTDHAPMPSLSPRETDALTMLAMGLTSIPPSIAALISTRKIDRPSDFFAT